MKTSSLAGSGLLLILLSSSLRADSQAEELNTQAEWRIQSGQVEQISKTPPLVSGTFAIISTNQPIDSYAAPMQGGACLVADLVPFGIGRNECMSNADCNGVDSIDKQRMPDLTDYVGYCVSRDGSQQAPRCWTRPGPPETHCRRTIDSLQLTVGTHTLGPVNADPLGQGEPYPEWAVYACMAHPDHEKACGEAVSPFRQISLTPWMEQRE